MAAGSPSRRAYVAGALPYPAAYPRWMRWCDGPARSSDAHRRRWTGVVCPAKPCYVATPHPCSRQLHGGSATAHPGQHRAGPYESPTPRLLSGLLLHDERAGQRRRPHFPAQPCYRTDCSWFARPQCGAAAGARWAASVKASESERSDASLSFATRCPPRHTTRVRLAPKPVVLSCLTSVRPFSCLHACPVSRTIESALEAVHTEALLMILVNRDRDQESLGGGRGASTGRRRRTRWRGSSPSRRAMTPHIRGGRSARRPGRLSPAGLALAITCRPPRRAASRRVGGRAMGSRSWASAKGRSSSERCSSGCTGSSPIPGIRPRRRGWGGRRSDSGPLGRFTRCWLRWSRRRRRSGGRS